MAGYIGSVFGSIASVWLCKFAIPSALSTMIQYRSGIIGSLHDPNFMRYRNRPDMVTNIISAMFWGALYTGLGVAFIAYILINFITNPDNHETVSNISGIVLGFSLTLLIKIGFLKFTRRKFYASMGLLRTNPSRANFSTLLVECWSLPLGSGFMLARGIMLSLISLFYIGRVDSPLFASGVGQIGNIDIDKYPSSFRRDIILHEAHRHPYMELMGTMYMMKLHHGVSFASRAGSCWRLIFVSALMPWMRRYRVMTRNLSARKLQN